MKTGKSHVANPIGYVRSPKKSTEQNLESVQTGRIRSQTEQNLNPNQPRSPQRGSISPRREPIQQILPIGSPKKDLESQRSDRKKSLSPLSPNKEVMDPNLVTEPQNRGLSSQLSGASKPSKRKTGQGQIGQIAQTEQNPNVPSKSPQRQPIGTQPDNLKSPTGQGIRTRSPLRQSMQSPQMSANIGENIPTEQLKSPQTRTRQSEVSPRVPSIQAEGLNPYNQLQDPFQSQGQLQQPLITSPESKNPKRTRNRQSEVSPKRSPLQTEGLNPFQNPLESQGQFQQPLITSQEGKRIQDQDNASPSSQRSRDRKSVSPLKNMETEQIGQSGQFLQNPDDSSKKKTVSFEVIIP